MSFFEGRPRRQAAASGLSLGAIFGLVWGWAAGFNGVTMALLIVALALFFGLSFYKFLLLSTQTSSPSETGRGVLDWVQILAVLAILVVDSEEARFVALGISMVAGLGIIVGFFRRTSQMEGNPNGGPESLGRSHH